MGSKKELSVEEICVMIKACGDARVRVLKFRGLTMEFSPPGELIEGLPPSLALARSLSPEKEISETEHQNQRRASLEADELRFRDAQLEQMILENPAEAERLLIAQELEAPEEEDDAEGA